MPEQVDEYGVEMIVSKSKSKPKPAAAENAQPAIPAKPAEEVKV